MADVKLPLMSAEAHGSIGKVLTFSNRKGSQKVRFQRKQKDLNTLQQQRIRYVTKWAVFVWKTQGQVFQDLWNAYTDSVGRTGYYAFLSAWARRALNTPGGYIVPAGQPYLFPSTIPLLSLMGPGTGPTLLDISPNQNHGDIHGADWVLGSPGQALDFPQNTDHVEIPFHESLTLSSPYSVQAWIKQQEFGTYECVLYQSGNPAAITLWSAYGKVKAMISDYTQTPSSAATTGIIPMKLNTWHLLTATYDGTLRTYLDGVLDGSAYAGWDPTDTSPRSRWLGARSATGIHTFKGIIRTAMFMKDAMGIDGIKNFYENTRPW